MRFYVAGYEDHPPSIKITPEAKYMLGSYFKFRTSKYGDYKEYHKKKDIFDGRVRFLDSGAFSAYFQKKPIDIEHYASFLKENKDVLEVYANLDVIGDPKATEQNQRFLESKGLNPLPTFHYGSDIKFLKKILKEYRYFALGGLVPIAKRKKALQDWLDYCFNEIIKTVPLPMVHGFGLSSYWAWERYPLFSTDSTAWLSVGKYGSSIKYKNGRASSDDKNSNRMMNFQLKQDKGYIQLQHNAILTYLKMADQATKLWKHRGVNWK